MVTTNWGGAVGALGSSDLDGSDNAVAERGGRPERRARKYCWTLTGTTKLTDASNNDTGQSSSFESHQVTGTWTAAHAALHSFDEGGKENERDT